MECPRCRQDKFSPDGTCLACSYKVEQTVTGKEPESGKEADKYVPPDSGEKPAGGTPSLSNKDELPPWRQELTQRLAALKSDKKTEENIGQTKNSPETPTPEITPMAGRTQPVARPPEHAGSIQVRSSNPEPPKSSDHTRSTTPQQKTIASLGPGLYGTSKSSGSKNIQEMIDSAVSKQSTQKNAAPPFFRAEPLPEQENKLILLSRTLSGLIDLIVIVLCTGMFIISADYFSGIEILDTVSLVECTGLFLMIFFLYSIFFLAASGQTVGMMITDLRLMGIEGSRPSIGQLFSRCFGYLLSIAVFGTGLLWSLFDRKNKCFHDRFSHTSITRI